MRIYEKVSHWTFAALFLLVGCGQKKETAASTTESSQEALQSTLPVLENATKNTVVTKTLVLPADESGAQQTQIITYKGNQFLSLTIQQKRPVSEDLKNYISERGLDEAKKLLKKLRTRMSLFKRLENFKDLPSKRLF